MQTSFLKSCKEYVSSAPKSALVFAGVGVVSLVGAALIAIGAHGAQPTKSELTTVGLHSSEQQNGGQHSGVLGANVVAGSSSNTTSSTPKNTPANAKNTASNSSTSSATGTGTAKSSASNQAQTPKADYNLNENWYLATAAEGGLYNTCWPTPLTQDNEAQCGDPNSVYSNMWFTGFGVSKNPDTAQTAAADQVHQKVLAQHVDPRKGAGGDAEPLTESLCSQYSLSCGRW